jgi:IS5 family transposase
MLLVSYLYGISERQTEELCNDSLSVKCFLGIAADERAPDHATLTLFKNRLVAKEGEGSFRGLFQEILRTAQRKGIKFGRIQVVDSTHTIADVNVAKDEKRQDKEGERPRDPDASWGVKGSKKVKDEAGQERVQKEYFYGYKTHLSINAENGLITSLKVTTGSAYDGHQLPTLVEQDLAQGAPAEVYAGDRGYDDGENHLYLWDKKLKSALKLNDYRTQKKDPNKGPWLALIADPDYQAGLQERYKVVRHRRMAKVRISTG